VGADSRGKEGGERWREGSSSGFSRKKELGVRVRVVREKVA
jgi:hypothetical protein